MQHPYHVYNVGQTRQYHLLGSVVGAPQVTAFLQTPCTMVKKASHWHVSPVALIRFPQAMGLDVLRVEGVFQTASAPAPPTAFYWTATRTALPCQRPLVFLVLRDTIALVFLVNAVLPASLLEYLPVCVAQVSFLLPMARVFPPLKLSRRPRTTSITQQPVLLFVRLSMSLLSQARTGFARHLSPIARLAKFWQISVSSTSIA